MYALALRRRLALAMKGEFDPYPAAPSGVNLSPFAEHRIAYADAPLALSWGNAGGDADTWQASLRDKLIMLSGYRRPEAPVMAIQRGTAVAPGPGLCRERLYLRAWRGADLPLDVVWREGVAEPAPLMICLQGTNSGAHLSWGEARMPPDPVKIAAGLDFARQAAVRGYIALCLEQRAFGERRETLLRPRSPNPCIDATLHAMLLGRSLLGDRVSDVSALLDWLGDGAAPGLPAMDLARSYILGHSSGGTVALHTAAFDTRIAATIASGCIGPIRDTFASRRDSSGQNIIPGQLLWCELSDVVGLVATRRLLVTSGEQDHIFPFSGASDVVAEGMAVYRSTGHGSRLRSVAHPGGHKFDAGRVWPAFEELLADA
jgi:hypothetical protein